MAVFDLTAERLRELLSYDPDTGLFRWRSFRAPGHKAGSVAGGYCAYGYIRIGVGQERHKAHRLAFLYMTGTYPPDDVDHINGVRDDNRWQNLRQVTRAMNCQNQRSARSNNKSGKFLGVARIGTTNKFRARIKVSGGPHQHIGVFDTAEAAHAAYVEAKRRLHPGCTI